MPVWTFSRSMPGAPTSTTTRETLVELCGWELIGNFAWDCDFHVNSGIFYVPQMCDMGPTALLPFWRKACWGIFRPEKSWRLQPGLNPRTWVPKGSMLLLDHRSRFRWMVFWEVLHSEGGFLLKSGGKIQVWVNWTKMKLFMWMSCHDWST